jgi:hypothetical protein
LAVFLIIGHDPKDRNSSVDWLDHLFIKVQSSVE